MSKHHDWRVRWRAFTHNGTVRTILFVTGLLLMALAPLVGVIPGPGGIIIFAAGLGLTLKYSEWAKRQYVRFKRSHPNKGRWADWGLRRRSAQRREEIRKQQDGGVVAPLSTGDSSPSCDGDGSGCDGGGGN